MLVVYHGTFEDFTIFDISKGEAISTKTLDTLCYVLDCEVSDIIKFEK